MAGLNSQYFKIGDKFDYSRFAIIRREEKDGVEHTSVVKVGVDFVGCTLVPGIGLRSPEPESIICLADGSFIDLRHKKHLLVTGNSITEDNIEYGDDGLATIDLNTGTSIVLNEDGTQIAKADDEGKLVEMKQEILDEKKLEEAAPLAVDIIETLSKSRKTSQFDLETLKEGVDKACQTSYDDGHGNITNYEHIVRMIENVTSAFAGEGAEAAGEKAMFSLRRKEGETTIETAAMIDNGVDKFMYFSPTQEVLDFFATEEGQKFLASEGGKNPAIQIIGEGKNAKYRFKVDTCTYKNRGCFEVAGSNGITFECNGGSIKLSFGQAEFVDRIAGVAKKGAKTKKAQGYECEVAKALCQKARKKEDGYSLQNESALDVLKDLDDVMLRLTSAGKEKNGVITYDDSQLSLFACSLPTSGTEKAVLFAKDNTTGKAYVLHNGGFVELNAEKLHELTEADPSKGRFKFSPRSKSQGHYVSLTYDTLGLKENELKVDALSRFLGEKGTTIKQARVLNAHSNEEFSKEIIPTFKQVTSKYKVTGLEPEKVAEQVKEEEKKTTETQETTEKKETTAKKGDPKKGNAFWNVISNASFYAMFFSLIACAFGLGFIAMPFALAFAAAGLVTKGIAYQGGFAANMTQEELDNAVAAAKEKAANKELNRRQRRYKAREEELAKNNRKITELESKLADLKEKGLDASKEGRKVKAEIAKLKKANKKLEKKNTKAEKGFTPLEALELMGKRPNISEIDLSTTREGFGKNESLYDSMIHNLLAEDTITATQGRTMDPIFGQTSFVPEAPMLNANSVMFLNELTPAERMQVFGEISELEEKYGGQQNNKFVEMFVEHDMLRQRQPLSTQDQKRYDELSQTILTAQKEMGPKMFETWSTFIRGEARDRYETFANEYGIADVQTVRNVTKNQRTIERLAGLTTRTPEQEAEFQAARTEIETVKRTIGMHSFEIEREAALEKARADIENPLVTVKPSIADVERKYSDPQFMAERIEHYGNRYYPKLVKGLDKNNQVLNAAANPLTIKTQLVDAYIATLEDRAVVTETFESAKEDRYALHEISTELFEEAKKKADFEKLSPEEKLEKAKEEVKEFATGISGPRSMVDRILEARAVGQPFEVPFGYGPRTPLDMSQVRINIPESIREKEIADASLEAGHTYELDHKTIEKYKKQGIDLLELVKHKKVMDELGKKPATELSDDEKKLLAKAEEYYASVGDKLITEKELQDIRDNTLGGETAVKKEVEKLKKKRLAKLNRDLESNNLAAHIEELNRISAKFDINAYDLARAEQTIRTLGGKETLTKQEEKLLAQAQATRQQIAIRAAEVRAFENGFENYLKKNGYDDATKVDPQLKEKLKKEYKKKYKQKFDGQEHKIAYGEEVLNEIYDELENNNLLSPKPVQARQAATLADTDSQIDKLKKKANLTDAERKELAELEKRRVQIEKAIEEQAVRKDFEKYLEEYCKRNNITDKEKVRKKAWAYYQKTLKDKSKRKKLNDEAMTELMDEMRKQGLLEDEKEDEDTFSGDETSGDASSADAAEKEKDEDTEEKDKKDKDTGSRRTPKTPKAPKKKKEAEEEAEVTSAYGEGEAPREAAGEYDMSGAEAKGPDKKKKKKIRPTADKGKGGK